MTDGTEDDVKNRFASRFENDDTDKDGASQTEQNDQNDRTEQASRSSRKPGGSQTVKNVKTEWNTSTFYLDDELSGWLNRLYKKLDWQLADEHDVALSKTRHYYPLVVQLGLEQLETLDSKEVKERLEDRDG